MEKYKNKITVLILGALLCWLGYKYFHALMYTAAGMVILSLLFSRVERLVIKYWLLFSGAVNKILTVVLLGFTFVAVLIPTAIIKKVLQRKENVSDSNFIIHDHRYTAEDLKNPW